MKTTKLSFFFLITFTLASVLHAQNVGVNTNAPNAAAALDIRSASGKNQGVLFPSIALTSVGDASSVVLPPKGLIVWNDATGGLTPEGFYYNAGTSGSPIWSKVAAGAVLTSTLSDGKIWIGNASNLAVEKTMSGDVTISNTGNTTIGANKIDGTKIDLGSGANGGMMYYNGTDWVDLAPGTSGQILQSNGAAAPSWVSPNSTLTKKDVSTSTTGLTIGNGTGQVVGSANLTINIAANSATSPGLVASPASATYKVWGTDGSGNPGWQSLFNDWVKSSTATTPATKTDNQYVSGNVGIGDFSAIDPGYKLHVGAGNGDGILIGKYNDQLGWNGTGTAPELALRFAGYRDVVSNFIGAKIAGIRTNICCSGLSQGMELSFQTQEVTATGSADGNLSEKMRIGNGGNVGIGISVPTEKLHVNGNALVNQNVIAGRTIITGDIEIVQGPGTGTDNNWHTVQLSAGYGAVGYSAYCTGSYMDGDIKMQGMDLGGLLSSTSNWYYGNAVASSLNANVGASCDNCVHSCNCPDGYIASGWQVYANAQLDYYMKIKCTQLATGYTTVETGMGVESIGNFPNANADNFTHVGVCPTGTFMKGLSINASTYLDNNLKAFCTGIKKQ